MAPPLAPSSAPPAVPGFVTGLRRFGGATALVHTGGQLTYDELADRVDELAGQLGRVRRLVLVEAAHTVEAVVGYLGALHAGCPVVLTSGATTAEVLRAYDPDVVLLADDRWSVQQRRSQARHPLHADLALLLSTSGSTGSPRLVRLSQENLSSNAVAVADSLGIAPDDVAVTTLPMAYCYGLSVLHSHLERGAAVVLTDLSVVDRCFWDLVRSHGVTSLAGVPHTFELLDRVGFDRLELPRLRRVTQAGGRLAPDRVGRFAELGHRRGWELFVMYGQTEATARMACLPAALALAHPGAIGVPVPGGALALEDVDAAGVGELVYSGPNVMLGYADGPADLALGRTTTRLRTGDLARRSAGGLYEIVGRRGRFSKVLGLRIDLSRVEHQVAELGTQICCAGGDDRLVVAARCERERAGEVCALVARAAGLPPRAVRLVAVDELPLLPNGKPDPRAVAALERAAPDRSPQPSRSAVRQLGASPRPGHDVQAMCALVAEVLDRPVAPTDTFVGLGGDSLSYVEVSLRLEQALGTLPVGWHTTPFAELVPAPPGRRRRGRAVESGVLLRALAIVLIVGSHADLFRLLGGAHVLLGVAGYNLARFLLTDAPGSPSRRLLRSARRVVVPSVAWIAVVALVTEQYDLTSVLLLNGVLGPDQWGPSWHYWFLEVMVALLLTSSLLLAVPAVRRAERRWPWGFAVVLLAAGVASRFQPGWLPTGPDRWHTAHVVLWLFALGWAAARADTPARRLLLTAVLLLTVPGPAWDGFLGAGFFLDARREALVVVGLLVLVWVRTVRVPIPVATAAKVLAAASLHVYVTHWVVYPPLEAWSPLAATSASIAVGLAYRELDVRLQARWQRHRRRAASRVDAARREPSQQRAVHQPLPGL